MEAFAVIGYLIIQVALILMFLWFPAMLWLGRKFSGSITRGEALFCVAWVAILGYLNYWCFVSSPLTVSIGVG